MRSSIRLHSVRLGASFLISVAALVMIPGSAAAQPAPDSVVRERVVDFIRGTGVARGETPAARWVDPVCPRVLGLQDNAARIVEARIRRVAADAGAELAPEPCNSNIVVTFAADAGGVVREVHRMRGRVFSDLPPDRRDHLLNSDAPVRWWHFTETRGRYGEGDREPGVSGQGQPASYSADDTMKYAFEGDTMQYDSSLISTFAQRAIESASVVIDLDHVMGRRLEDVAEYAALVALSEIRSGDYASEDSVLGMFGSRDRNGGLTAQDEAFLRALYRLPLDRQASRHRGMLAREMMASRTGD